MFDFDILTFLTAFLLYSHQNYLHHLLRPRAILPAASRFPRIPMGEGREHEVEKVVLLLFSKAKSMFIGLTKMVLLAGYETFSQLRMEECGTIHPSDERVFSPLHSSIVPQDSVS